MNGLEVKWSKSVFFHFPIEGFNVKIYLKKYLFRF